LVDEKNLTEVLGNGHLAAAGLDVFAEEPVRPDHPLLRLNSVVVILHLA
jgi:phosphoglycerate dehydrogenase-like enzyme